MPLFKSFRSKRRSQPTISLPIHLLLKPDIGGRSHCFKSKVVRKPRTCHLCHQPIQKIASCCKVCKYTCHPTCEPKGSPVQLLPGRRFGNISKVIYDEWQEQNIASFPMVASSPVLQHQYQYSGRETPVSQKQKNLKHSGVRMHDSLKTEVTAADDFELDYVTEKVISIFFRDEIDDEQYFKRLKDMADMLHSKHRGNYVIFNLTERNSTLSKLHQNVKEVGWPRGLAPTLEKLGSICKYLDMYMNSDASNNFVFVLFSRGDFERTGVVLQTYINYCRICGDANQLLDQYAMKRFFNNKISIIKQPSNRRYIDYFAGLLSGDIKGNLKPLYLSQMLIRGIPDYDRSSGCSIFVKIYQGLIPIFTSGMHNIDFMKKMFHIVIETAVQLKGDILVKCYHKDFYNSTRTLMFQCQFHTCAILEGVMTLSVNELDEAFPGLNFPIDGQVSFTFSYSSSSGNTRHTSSPVYDMNDPMLRWNSYENFDAIESSEGNDLSMRQTPGPVNGSLYASVVKKKSPNPSPTDINSSHETDGFADKAHTTSMDSGISSNSEQNKAAVSSSSPHSPPRVDFESGAPAHHRSDHADTIESHHRSMQKTIVEIHESVPKSSALEFNKANLDFIVENMMSDVKTIPDLVSSPKKGIDLNDLDFQYMDSESRSETLAEVQFDGNVKTRSRIDSGSPPFHLSEPPDLRRPEKREAPARNHFSDSSLEHACEREVKEIYSRRDDSDRMDSSFHSDDSAYPAAALKSPRLVRKFEGKNLSPNFEEVHKDPSSTSKGLPFSPSSRSPMLYPERTPEKSKLYASQSYNCSPIREEESEISIRKRTRPNLSRSLSNSCDSTTDWLEKQKLKLQSRRYASIRSPQGEKLLSELRAMQKLRGSHEEDHLGVPDSESKDGVTLRREYNIPLHVNTSLYENAADGKPVNEFRKTDSELSRRLDRSLTLDSVRRHHSDEVNEYNRNVLKSSADGQKDRNFVNFQQNQESTAARNENWVSSSKTRALSNSVCDIDKNSDGLLVPVIHERHRQESAGDVDSYREDRMQENLDVPIVSSPYGSTVHGSVHSVYKSPAAIRSEYSKPPKVMSRSPLPADHFNSTIINGPVSPIYFGNSRSSLNDSFSEIIVGHPIFVKDVSKYWYKPKISREEAINYLKDKPEGTFLVRDSTSYPGCYGLVLKVSKSALSNHPEESSSDNDLVRHFLIELTKKGVRLRGSPNEPVFGSLSALVYQHSLTPIYLPCKLIIPEADHLEKYSADVTDSTKSSHFENKEACCNALYLYSMDTESLTGPQAIHKALSCLFVQRPIPKTTVVQIKINLLGIMLTDVDRKLFFRYMNRGKNREQSWKVFFRRHYPSRNISYCGVDPEDRYWSLRDDDGIPTSSHRCFGFVAKKQNNTAENQCHLFAELSPKESASEITRLIHEILISAKNQKKL